MNHVTPLGSDVTCQACREACHEFLAAGRHPIANCFVRDPHAKEDLYPLAIGQCVRCGLIQLLTPVPVDALVPPYDWITYREPEAHLDALVDALIGLSGVSADAVVAGVTYKDDSTLARLERRGFPKTWRLDPEQDLGITAPQAGLESIQARLRPDVAAEVARRRGRADLVIARHVLEHAYNVRAFAAALGCLAKTDGYVVLEVPDCTLLLETLDYTMVWEEHILYFTPSTLQTTLQAIGLPVVRFDSYPYPFENSLVAVAQPRQDNGLQVASGDIAAELRRAQRYAASLEGRRGTVVAFLGDFHRDRGRIAMFGAGHLACMFVNLMGVADHIDFVIDDHPSKRGLFLPGSRLPIRSSDELERGDIRLCLMSLSPESEEKVVANQPSFLARGGIFASVFPASRRALRF